MVATLVTDAALALLVWVSVVILTMAFPNHPYTAFHCLQNALHKSYPVWGKKKNGLRFFQTLPLKRPKLRSLFRVSIVFNPRVILGS